MIQKYINLQPIVPQYKRTFTISRGGVIHGIFISISLLTSKCKVLHIGKDNPRKDYKMKVRTDLVNVQTWTEEKDLGITFDNLLKFDVHIQNAVSKANRMIGILRRTFTFLDKDTFFAAIQSI